MDKTDMRIKEIDNRLTNIERKRRKYLTALHSLYVGNTRYNYYKTNKSAQPEKLETLPSYMGKEIGDNLRSGLLTPYTFGRLCVDAGIKAMDKKGFMVVPGTLCGMLAFPAVVIDAALLPLVLFHNHITLAAVYGVWGKVAKHRLKKWEANLPKIKKEIADLRKEKEQLLVKKEGVSLKEEEKLDEVNSKAVKNNVNATKFEERKAVEEQEDTL